MLVAICLPISMLGWTVKHYIWILVRGYDGFTFDDYVYLTLITWPILSLGAVLDHFTRYRA